MPIKRKPIKLRKMAKRTSRRTISRPRGNKRTSRTKPELTAVSLQLPQTWGPECFNQSTIDQRGFQASDLKPRYFAAYNKLIAEYGQGLVIDPTGNPGITLSLRKD